MFDYPAYKLHIEELNMCIRIVDQSWKLELKLEKFPNITKFITLKYVWLQGFIEQTAGREKEIIIVSDKTGRVKVTHCKTVPGGSSWMVKGMYVTKLPDVL